MSGVGSLYGREGCVRILQSPTAGGLVGPEVSRSCTPCRSCVLYTNFFPTLLWHSVCAGLLPGGVGSIVGRTAFPAHISVCARRGFCALFSLTVECFTITTSSGYKTQSSVGDAVMVLWTTSSSLRCFCAAFRFGFTCLVRASLLLTMRWLLGDIGKNRTINNRRMPKIERRSLTWSKGMQKVQILCNDVKRNDDG